MNLEITNRKAPTGDDYECIIVVRWYAAVVGNLFMEFVGFGPTPEAAEVSARLMLGQGRSKLNEVTAKEPA